MIASGKRVWYDSVMKDAEFIDLALTNPHNAELMARLDRLGLPDCWLVSGALFQTVWNALTGRSPTYGIRDYDVFYFDDTDLSWDAEDAVIRQVADATRDMNIEVEVRNQARVHLWYTEKFGGNYPPLANAHEAIDRFLSKACMVGLKRLGDDVYRLYAPAGLDDIAQMIARPNFTANYAPEKYTAKVSRWKEKWPELQVLSANLPAEA